MPLLTGNSGSRSADTSSSSTSRDETGTSTVRLRVSCWKSAYLALSVAVRPLIVDPSQWDQTLAMSGSRATRASSAVKRSAFWAPDLQATPRGRIIYLRRTGATGGVELLGRSFEVDATWPHRLVRAEVDLDLGRIRFYALRRRDPAHQPLLREVAYKLPRRRFRE
jgi:hypothetical protein